MQNTFQILAGFLERFDGEVEGREFQELTESVSAKLRDFAVGSLPKAEQAELMTLLSQNPAWISRLAEEIKARRTTSNS